MRNLHEAYMLQSVVSESTPFINWFQISMVLKILEHIFFFVVKAVVIWRSMRAATFLARLNYFDLSHCALCMVPGVSYENVTWMLFFEFSYSAPVLSTHSVAGISRFDFSNWYIWFEFYNAPLENDVSLICDASNFSWTPVMVFWAMKWNHYEVYVA